MFRKRYLFIFVPAVMLAVVGSMIFVGSDWYGSYAVCRDYLVSRGVPDVAAEQRADIGRQHDISSGGCCGHEKEYRQRCHNCHS